LAGGCLKRVYLEARGRFTPLKTKGPKGANLGGGQQGGNWI